MFRFFDFECAACGHVFEEMIDDDRREQPCNECNGPAKRQASAPRLDWRRMGTDPGFPTAYERWGNAQTERNKQASERAAL
jgi:putative FmdB family regulatory protein